MLFVRKIGSVLRGKATPLQVMLATVFAGVLGFVPGCFLPGDLGGGLLQAPGLILLLLCCVMVLNANLALFGLVLLLAKLVSFALLPLSYAVGSWLLDGPLQGLFRALVNGKGTAWFGFEYYATTGGLVVGLLFGVLTGVLLNRTMKKLRTHMAGLEENSERYQKLTSRKSVRFLTWLFLGKGKGKTSWQDLAAKKVGMPLRLSGVLAAAVLVASAWVFQSWFSTPILTRTVHGALESINGATVDLKAARVGLSDGQILLEGLAIADSERLDRDFLAADVVTARLDMGELARKRFVIDEVKSTNARGGTQRSTPGVLIPGEAPPPEPPPPPAGTKTAEDWLADYELWKDRLLQAAEWIEKIAGGGEPPAPKTPEEQRAERERQEQAGLAMVVATHLLDQAPRFVIRRIDIEGIDYSIDGKADKFDLRARNLSSAPSLLPDMLSFAVKNQSDSLAFGIDGRSASKADLGFSFAMKGIPADSLFGKLKISGSRPVSGGTIDLAAKGSFARVAGQVLAMDLPLSVAMKDTTWTLGNTAPTKIESLVLPIGLRGPVSRPAVALDDQALQNALLAAGQQQLANYVQGQAGKLLGGVAPQLQGVIDPNKSVGENVEQAQQKVVDEAKARLEAEKKKAEEDAKKKLLDEAKKKLPGITIPGGILPGGGK
ncbi:MAG: hypothetical protein WAT39_14760 [Planctomycetota bacterium]